MPASDRTGPWGMGPRTGRGLGHCSGYPGPGYMMTPGPGSGFGRGFGRGPGLGRGFGHGMGLARGRRFRHPGARGFWGASYAPAVPFGYSPGAGIYPPVNEEAALAEEAAFLDAELGRIRERLDELKKDQEEYAKGEKK